MLEFFMSLLPDRFESAVMAVGAVMGAAFIAVFGEFNNAFAWLLGFMALDYLSGSVAAWIQHIYSSDAGLKGLTRKSIILLLVLIANGADALCVGIGLPFSLRDVMICALGLNEIVSLIENIDRMGCGDLIPGFVRTGLQRLQKAAEKKIEGVANENAD